MAARTIGRCPFGLCKAELLSLKVQDVNLKDWTIKLAARLHKMTNEVPDRLKPCIAGKELG